MEIWIVCLMVASSLLFMGIVVIIGLYLALSVVVGVVDSCIWLVRTLIRASKGLAIETVEVLKELTVK